MPKDNCCAYCMLVSEWVCVLNKTLYGYNRVIPFESLSNEKVWFYLLFFSFFFTSWHVVILLSCAIVCAWMCFCMYVRACVCARAGTSFFCVSVRVLVVCACACACVCMYGYHIAVSIKTLAPVACACVCKLTLLRTQFLRKKSRKLCWVSSDKWISCSSGAMVSYAYSKI